MKPTIIAILGAPGVGKTYYAEKIAQACDAELIKEPPITKRILQNFKDNERSLETILYFLNEGIKNIEKANVLKDRGDVVIMDTCWISTILHIETMLDGYEQEIMLTQKNLLKNYLPYPDALIYLTASQENIKNNISERDRDFDTSETFLRRSASISHEHESYFAHHDHIKIDCESLKFEAEESVSEIIEKIINYDT